MHWKANLLNRYFQSAYSSAAFQLTTTDHGNDTVYESTLTNFSISKKIVETIMVETVVTKSRGSGGIMPVSFRKLSNLLGQVFNTVFKTIKRLWTIPDEWKYAILPILRKEGGRLFDNYWPLPLLVLSKVLEKRLNEPLYNYFAICV